MNKDYIAAILLSFPIIMLPLEGLFSFTLGPFSITALSVIPMALYAIFMNTRLFIRSFFHPCLLIGLALLLWGTMIEIFQGYPSYIELLRNLENLFFIAMAAAIIRSTRIMRIVLNIWITISTLLGIYFIISLFAKVNVSVETYMQATILRNESLKAMILSFNWNSICYFVGIGGICAFGALLEKTRGKLWRIFLLFCTLCCLIGSFVLLYRGPILMVTAAFSFMIISNIKDKRRRLPVLIVACTLISTIVFLPRALPKRFDLEDPEDRYVDPRVKIYSVAIKNIPDYFLYGIGRLNYYNSWGPEHGLKHSFYVKRNIERAPGLHNAFLQFFVFYGVIALSFLILLVLRAGKILRSLSTSFPLYITINGLAIAGLSIMLLSHSLFAKELGLILGMLIASERMGRRDHARSF